MLCRWVCAIFKWLCIALCVIVCVYSKSSSRVNFAWDVRKGEKVLRDYFIVVCFVVWWQLLRVVRLFESFPTRHDDDDATVDAHSFGAWGDYDWILRVVLLPFSFCYTLVLASAPIWIQMPRCESRWLCAADVHNTLPPLVRWRSCTVRSRRQVRPRYVWNVSRWIFTIISATTQNSSGGVRLRQSL